MQISFLTIGPLLILFRCNQMERNPSLFQKMTFHSHTANEEEASKAVNETLFLSHLKSPEMFYSKLGNQHFFLLHPRATILTTELSTLEFFTSPDFQNLSVLWFWHAKKMGGESSRRDDRTSHHKSRAEYLRKSSSSLFQWLGTNLFDVNAITC